MNFGMGCNLKPAVTFKQLLLSRPLWVLRRCRRVIPPPEELYPLIKKLFSVWGPLKDAKTHLPLFNAQNWKTAKQILELIREGFVSDPPGIPLYTILGLDKKSGNLPIYRCARGTNFTEGGVHTHLRSRLPTSGASIRHVNACLHDFVLQHNLRVCVPFFLDKSQLMNTTSGWNLQYNWPKVSWSLFNLDYE